MGGAPLGFGVEQVPEGVRQVAEAVRFAAELAVRVCQVSLGTGADDGQGGEDGGPGSGRLPLGEESRGGSVRVSDQTGLSIAPVGSVG